jgi:hypothetical protein
VEDSKQGRKRNKKRVTAPGFIIRKNRARDLFLSISRAVTHACGPRTGDAQPCLMAAADNDDPRTRTNGGAVSGAGPVAESPLRDHHGEAVGREGEEDVSGAGTEHGGDEENDQDDGSGSEEEGSDSNPNSGSGSGDDGSERSSASGSGSGSGSGSEDEEDSADDDDSEDSDDDEDDDSSEEEEEDEEPSLKYSLLSGSIPSLLKKDSASAVAVVKLTWPIVVPESAVIPATSAATGGESFYTPLLLLLHYFAYDALIIETNSFQHIANGTTNPNPNPNTPTKPNTTTPSSRPPSGGPLLCTHLLALSTHTGLLHILTLPHLYRIKSYKPHTASILSLSFSADGEWLGTASMDGTVTVRHLNLPLASVSQVAASPNTYDVGISPPEREGQGGEAYTFDLRRPMNSISLSPTFSSSSSSSRAFVCGGLSGSLYHYAKHASSPLGAIGLGGISGLIPLPGLGAIPGLGGLGGGSHRQTVLSGPGAGNGKSGGGGAGAGGGGGSEDSPIWSVKFQPRWGRLVVWADDRGIKIYDLLHPSSALSESHSSSSSTNPFSSANGQPATGAVIAFIARPPGSPPASLFKPSIMWKDEWSLIVGWAERITLVSISALGPEKRTSTVTPHIPNAPAIAKTVAAGEGGGITPQHTGTSTGAGSNSSSSKAKASQKLIPLKNPTASVMASTQTAFKTEIVAVFQVEDVVAGIVPVRMVGLWVLSSISPFTFWFCFGFFRGISLPRYRTGAFRSTTRDWTTRVLARLRDKCHTPSPLLLLPLSCSPRHCRANGLLPHYHTTPPVPATRTTPITPLTRTTTTMRNRRVT